MAVEATLTNVVIEEIDISLLRPHPRNIEIYGIEDVSELTRDIQENGLKERIIVNPHNQIVSGHRRTRVLESLGYKKVVVEKRTYTDEIEERKALLLANAFRDKTNMQMAREQEEWLDIRKKEADEKQRAQGEHGKEGGRGHKKEETLVENFPQGLLDPKTKASEPNEPPKKQREPASRDKAAKDVGFGSGKSGQKAAKALNAVKKLEQEGKVEEARALENIANKSLDAASKVADVSKEENIAALSKIATGEAKDVKTAKQSVRREQLAEKAKTIVLPQDMQLLHGDFLEIGRQIADDSVSLVFTDPPYHEKHLELWSNLGSFAARVLKPGGMLLAYSGQIALPQVLNALSEHLDYCWLLGQFHRGQHLQIWKYQIWNEWKPLVLFSKGKPVLNEWFIDAYDGVKGDKEAHEWAQGEDEAQYFIQKMTQPGDLVVDPMCGSGPIVRMAHRFKRQSIGIEIEKERYDVALGSMKVLAEA